MIMPYKKIFPLTKTRRNLQVFIHLVQALTFFFAVNIFFPQIVDLYKALGIETLSSIYKYPLTVSMLIAIIPFVSAMFFLNKNYHFTKLPFFEKDEERVYWFSFFYAIVVVVLLSFLIYLPIYQLPNYI